MSPVTVPLTELAPRLAETIRSGGRLGLLTARRLPADALALLAVVLTPEPLRPGGLRPELWQAAIEHDELPPLTRIVPQAHWSRRALWDFFGLRPADQARPNPLLLHEAWPADYHPLRGAPCPVPEGAEPAHHRFLEVEGEGVYEIPVGPIHAGIIEPGHFRFSCLGEVIQNLEIRLGYQHRGMEQQLAETSWRRGRFLAEAISSDTVVGNALAHALAIEDLLGLPPPPQASLLRALALEIERIACHLGDLGGLCADVGFAAGAALFSRLRAKSQGIAERLTGSRFLTGYILPGGVARGVGGELRAALIKEAVELARWFDRAEPLLLDNAGALERMDGTGVVPALVAADIGLVGPAGRASGLGYDVRAAFAQPPYGELGWQPASGTAGDVLARATIRAAETRASLALLPALLDQVDEQAPLATPLPVALPPDHFGIGIVEAWRGELIHLVVTAADGSLVRYAVKDPSFNNWTGLAIAARGEVVSDFPLCNKSFGLSYSGNDR